MSPPIDGLDIHDVPRAVALDRLVAIETDECVVWPFGRTSAGYGHLSIDGEIRYAHAESCERSHGPRGVGMHAAHSCGNRACVNARHLRWDSPLGNAADQVVHGTRLRGEQVAGVRLTEVQVREARALRAEGRTYVSIAERYGVSWQCIRHLVLGNSWGWLT